MQDNFSKPAAQIAIINSRITRGDVSAVADMTGYSVSYVSRVFRGLRNNDEILDQGAYYVSWRSKNRSRY